MAKKTISKKISGLGPKKSKDIPATKSMLDATRAELKADITSLRLEMLSGFKAHDARFDRIEALIVKNDAKFERMLALYEEQSARNVFVLDGYAHIHAQNENLNQRVGKVEVKLFGKSSSS